MSLFAAWTWIVPAAGILIGCLGALCFLISSMLFVRTFRILCRGRRAIATVVGYRDENEEFVYRRARHHHITTSAAARFHVPIFRFEDDNTETHEVEGMGTIKRRFQVGDQIPLIYLPGDPTVFVADHFVDKWIPALVAFIISGILFVFPVLLFFLR